MPTAAAQILPPEAPLPPDTVRAAAPPPAPPVVRIVVPTGLTAAARARWTAPLEEPAAAAAVPSGWTRRLVARASGAQAAFHNWTAGGVNTLSLTGRVEGTFDRRDRPIRQTHTVALALGGTIQQRQERRKTDDEIRLESSVRLARNTRMGTLRPTVAVGLRTQFAAGYAYDKNPFTGTTADLPVKVSDVFAPAILTQSLGLTAEPARGLVQRVGVGGRQVIVAVERFGVLNGLREGRRVRGEAGLDARTDLDRRIAENVRLTASLGLFADLLRATPVDVTFESALVLRVNRWLQTNIRVQSIVDADRSRGVQLREAIDIGLTLPIL